MRYPPLNSQRLSRRRLTRLGLVAVLWLAASVSAPARAGDWPDEYRLDQFICHADFRLAPYRSLLDSIPRLQGDLTEALGIPASSEPVHLFLFEKKSTYQTYVKEYFPEVPSRKALFIKGRGPGMVFAHLGEGFEDDVRHECTHALLNAALPMVPLWLDEGLAKYFEVPADQRRQGSAHMSSLKWSARFGQLPRLEALERVREVNEMSRPRYRHAWAWVHFMLNGPPAARDELRRYLADIHALTPPGLLSERLRHRVPDLEQKFADHFRNWKAPSSGASLLPPVASKPRARLE